MIVFNITDDPSASLIERGLANVSIQAGAVVIAPGASATMPDRYRGAIQGHVNCGALAIGSPPAGYTPKQAETEVPPTESTAVAVKPEVAADLPERDTEPISGPVHELAVLIEDPTKKSRKKRKRG